MKSNQPNVHSFQTDSFDLTKTAEIIKISEIFSNHDGSEIDETKLFIAHFNKIPNYFSEVGINCKKAHHWFIENYKKEIVDVYYNKKYFHK